MKKHLHPLFALLVVAALALSACGPAVGSAEKPIKILFVPSVDAAEIVAGGELLVAELE